MVQLNEDVPEKLCHRNAVHLIPQQKLENESFIPWMTNYSTRNSYLLVIFSMNLSYVRNSRANISASVTCEKKINNKKIKIKTGQDDHKKRPPIIVLYFISCFYNGHCFMYLFVYNAFRNNMCVLVNHMRYTPYQHSITPVLV